MFGIGMPELLIILAVALIVLGPKKLPEIAKSLGKAMGEFKRATNDLKQTIEQETGLGEVRDSLRETQRDLQRSLKEGDAPVSTTAQTPDVKETAAAPDEKDTDKPLAPSSDDPDAHDKTKDSGTL
jgi:sec-independent protein translocase protein TatB